MARSRSIYAVSIYVISIFYFHLHFHEYRNTCSFAYFLEYVALLFLDDNMDEECE